MAYGWIESFFSPEYFRLSAIRIPAFGTSERFYYPSGHFYYHSERATAHWKCSKESSNPSSLEKEISSPYFRFDFEHFSSLCLAIFQ
jgi:hypothetical protein